MQIKIENARLNWAAGLFAPSAAVPGATEKYNCHLILMPDTICRTMDGAAISPDAAIEKIAREAFGANWKPMLEAISWDKKCVRPGSRNIDKDGNVRPEYQGNLFIAAKNSTAPAVFDNCNDPQTGKVMRVTEQSGRIYSGCRVNAKIEIYAMVPAAKRSIACTVLGVQFFKDDTRLSGGGVASPDDFDAVVDTSAVDGLL